MTDKKDYSITPAMAAGAVDVCWDWMVRRISQKGDLSFSSLREAYGVIVEEYHELVAAVQANDRTQVRREALDIFVPCIFELASIRERAAAMQLVLVPVRVKVDEKKARAIVDLIKPRMTVNKVRTSIHDILGGVSRIYTLLQDMNVRDNDHSRALDILALECLIAIASLDSVGTMDW